MAFLKQIEGDGQAKVMWDQETLYLMKMQEEEKEKHNRDYRKVLQKRKPRPRDFIKSAKAKP